MIRQTPAAAEIEKWLRILVRVFTNLLLRIRIRKKNARCCRSRLRIHGHLWCLVVHVC